MRKSLKTNLTATTLPAKTLFHVVIVYEDAAAATGAMQTWSFLKKQLEPDFELRVSMWKFDLLQNGEMQELAVNDALEANLIIVASHTGTTLPMEIESWVQLWASRKRDDSAALIALLDQSAHAQAKWATFDFLKGAAARAGMQFLPHVRYVQIEPPAPAAQGQRRPFGEATRPARENWGLND
jgi:hypothetical protein